MRIFLLTEGDSEYRSLPILYPQLTSLSAHDFIGTTKVNVSPDASASVIARECKSRMMIAATKRADLVLVVLDREQVAACPGEIARDIEAEIARQCVAIPVHVVLKDRTFENWLLADLDALAVQRARFNVTQAVRRRVEPNKADRVNALQEIKRMAIGRDYNKREDAERICQHMDVSRAATHSRSMRHLLHVIGVPSHSGTCR